MTFKLPLFPLNTVLFPGAPLLLHIFEERYRQMIARCLEQSSTFGVVLIRSGSEVDPNDPFVRRLLGREVGDDIEQPRSETTAASVGTTVRINESHQLEDGRYHLTTVGVRRFRIQYIVQQQPTMTASVAFLPEQTVPELPAMAAELHELYRRYWQSIEVTTGQRYDAEALPDDPVELSYLLAHRLRVDTERKQSWLEADAATRLRELRAALQGELALMRGGNPGGARSMN
jgi:Lon protease-like protein